RADALADDAEADVDGWDGHRVAIVVSQAAARWQSGLRRERAASSGEGVAGRRVVAALDVVNSGPRRKHLAEHLARLDPDRAVAQQDRQVAARAHRQDAV